MRAAIMLLLLLPVSVTAQIDPPRYRGTLLRGMRVRVSAPGLSSQPLTRTVADTRPDTLILAPTGTENRYLVVPLSDVGTLEVQREGPGSRIGGAVGALAGLGLGVLAANALFKGDGCTEGFDCLDQLGEKMIGGALTVAACGAAGGLAGFVLGRTIGKLIAPDVWETVPRDRLRVGLAPRAGGGVTMGMAIAF